MMKVEIGSFCQTNNVSIWQYFLLLTSLEKLREKINALRAFIYKASRGIKKVGVKNRPFFIKNTY
jgi:hypothetical protein